MSEWTCKKHARNVAETLGWSALILGMPLAIIFSETSIRQLCGTAEKPIVKIGFQQRICTDVLGAYKKAP